VIDSYSFGCIVIGDKTFSSDIILLHDCVHSSWRRESGHRLNLEDLSQVPFLEYDVFIVGTGAMGMMKVEEEVKDFLKSKNIELIILKTREAVRKYNEISPKKRTAAAFHLTC
jgi:hypothetical protein